MGNLYHSDNYFKPSYNLTIYTYNILLKQIIIKYHGFPINIISQKTPK